MRSSIKVRIYEDCITGLKNRLAEGEIDVPITRPMNTQSPAVKEFVKSARRFAIAYRLPQG